MKASFLWKTEVHYIEQNTCALIHTQASDRTRSVLVPWFHVVEQSISSALSSMEMEQKLFIDQYCSYM